MNQYDALPEVFLQRLNTIVPEPQRQAVLASFSLAKPTGFRVNTLKTGIETVATELTQQGFTLTPAEFYQAAFSLPQQQKRALTETGSFARGDIYIQNFSSMMPVLLLDPQPGETVLDLAAAPGGKTTLMAAMMQNQGWLSAVEPVKARFFRLKRNLEQQGVNIAHTYLMDGRAVGNKTPQRFDRILLDAPCSSEARFTTLDPSSWAHWNLNKVRETSKKQKRLLLSAVQALKPGGRLLYCTCSFSPEENERIVDYVLKRHADELEVLPMAVPWATIQPGLTQWKDKNLDDRLVHAVRILPDENFDGFFMCLLVKNF